MMGEVVEPGSIYFMHEGRIVKLDLESEKGFTEVNWDDSDFEYEEDETFIKEDGKN